MHDADHHSLSPDWSSVSGGRKRERHLQVKHTPKKQKISEETHLRSDQDLSESIHRCRSSDPRKKKRRRKKEEGKRSWVFSSSRDFSAYKYRFVLVSYNILGVENASKHEDLYDKVSPQYLEWGRRKKLIRKEINRYNSSILCFQEVDRFNDLADLLHKDGYKGIYKGRTGEACDGCAIFWKEEQFTVVHHEGIEFKEFGLRDNVAQLCVLKMNLKQSHSSRSKDAKHQVTESCPSLVVGNIHVLFNPNRGDIKLGQVRLLLEKAYVLSREWGNIPVVIGGDLNSMPQSGIYQFLASSKLDILDYDRRKISGQIEYPVKWNSFRTYRGATERFPMSISNPLRYRWSEEEIQLAAGSRGCSCLQHQLKLYSAYAGVPGSRSTRNNNGEPLATSYHAKFMGTVDYVWHSEELVPVRVLETLPTNILRKMGGLPSKKWGSDHLALACELAFAGDNGGSNA